jgi:hypothetical protein
MWKNIVQLGMPRVTTWRMRVACWIPKATDTHSEYVIITAFPLQHCLQERDSMLRCTYMACLVISKLERVQDIHLSEKIV